eukprot:SAG11_NODE_36544_length_261_cov_0.629630_1_plen_40_part_10
MTAGINRCCCHVHCAYIVIDSADRIYLLDLVCHNFGRQGD